jgi:hypothetical protein
MIIVLTICATLAATYAKQLNDARDLEIQKQLNTIVEGDNWRREYAYEIMFDGAKEPPELPKLDEAEVAEFLLELEEIDPELAAQAIQSLSQLPTQ